MHRQYSFRQVMESVFKRERERKKNNTALQWELPGVLMAKKKNF